MLRIVGVKKMPNGPPNKPVEGSPQTFWKVGLCAAQVFENRVSRTGFFFLRSKLGSLERFFWRKNWVAGA